MIRFDMSEFSEVGAVDNFIARLTDEVRDRPFSLVLLDEFEKAEPQIHNLFLQVMEDGRLTSKKGQVVDFRNTIVIATRNSDNIERDFRRELLNRFDGIVRFKSLTKDQMLEIARLAITDLKQRMEEKQIKLSWSDELIEELAHLGYDEKYGARPLRRIIQDRLEDRLATKILREEIKPGDTYYLTVGDLV